MGNTEREQEKQIWDRLASDADAVLARAIKHDAGKVPLHLVDPLLIRETARVLDYGQQKYTAWNWANGTFEWHRLYRATIGHLMDWYEGEDYDPESGLPHLAHASCCLMFLMRYQHMGWGTDDRPAQLAMPLQLPHPVHGRPLPTCEEPADVGYQASHRVDQGSESRTPSATYDPGRHAPEANRSAELGEEQ